ncbi:substrate-binding domain-containing protein, partial [Klebsiella pneumoniae]|uniref:substrate-binding domain-containing protein n=1 Tax=Klebsiella pneumoniae TaxID=573 RepID=UPI00210F09AF
VQYRARTPPARAECRGEVAVLSATPTSTNQNIWIEEMKKVLPQYPSVQLVTVAYGDDLSDKSYREAVGLLKSYPDLKVIVSPSSQDHQWIIRPEIH